MYKRYCDMLAKDILEQDVSKMDKTALREFLKQVQSLSIYSQKCFSLREEYRDTCVEESKRDEGHEIAIQNAKDYHNLTSLILNRIAARFEELNKEEREESTLSVQSSTSSDESTREQSNNSFKKSPRKSKKKKSKASETTTSNLSDPTEEDPFVISTLAQMANVEIESRRDALYTRVIDLLEATMKKFNIGFTEKEFFILIQRLSLSFTGESFRSISEKGLRVLEEKLKKITKEVLVTTFVQVKKDVNRQYIRIKDDGSLEKTTAEIDLHEITIPVKINVAGQDLELYLFKNQNIKEFKDSLVKTFQLNGYTEFADGMRKGGTFVILNKKGKALKDSDIVKDVIKPYERIQPILYV